MNSTPFKINTCCPVCDKDISIKTGKYIDSFGQLYHYPNCWKVEVMKARADTGV